MEGSLEDLEPGPPAHTEDGEEEDKQQEEEEQDDFFQEFEKELMEADVEETPRAGTTPRTSLSKQLLFSPRKESGSDPLDHRGARPSPALECKHVEQQRMDTGVQPAVDEGPAGLKTPPASRPAGGLFGSAKADGSQPGPSATPLSTVTPVSVLTEAMEYDLEDDSEGAKMERLAQRNRAILKKLNDRQLHQYEAFRRSKLDAGMMKKLIHAITLKHPAFNVNDKNLLIVLCGVAKIYVGEIIEKARSIATSNGYDGPLQPSHVRTAYSELDQKSGKIPHRQNPKRMKL